MMDVNKIFNLFDDSGSGSLQPKSQDPSISLEEYKNHPLFWVGMFKKLISNYHLFTMLAHNLDEEVSSKYTGEERQNYFYNRGWDFISKVNPEDKLCQEALFRYADKELEYIFILTLNHFQDLEEYEKCAHLKKNLDFVKLLLT